MTIIEDNLIICKFLTELEEKIKKLEVLIDDDYKFSKHDRKSLSFRDLKCYSAAIERNEKEIKKLKEYVGFEE